MSNDETLSVMVVDDEPGIRTALRANFLRHGWRVETASNVREAIRNVEDHEFNLVVTDMRMPDGTGMEVMRAARKASPETAVILLTAYGSVPDAVTAMRDGALDYLTKPIPFDRLQAMAAQLMSCVRRSTPVEDGLASGDIVGRSPLLLRALQRARAAASAGADVLIEAESGTGKELLARYIHDYSDRSSKPFVAVNCAAVPETFSRVSCLAMVAEPLPEPSQTGPENSSWQTAGRSCSMRLERCLSVFSRSFCGFFRNASSTGSVKVVRYTQILGLLPQPTFRSPQ